jgi:predicted nucleotide-binding protein (sugar kinase/HSP70/actin superfamily)
MSKRELSKTVGLSLERSPGSIGKWKKFFEILGVECAVSDLQPEKAAKKAEKVFKYSLDYCFFRKSCLGQYIDLIERGIKTIVVPVKIKDGHLACNSSRFMATEVAEYYRTEVDVINAMMYTSDKKMTDLRNIAELFCNDEETIEKALEVWRSTERETRKNVFLSEDRKFKRDITVMVVGKINHFFDYTDATSPMMRYLAERLGVKVVDPENVPHSDFKDFKKAYRTVHEVGLSFKKNRDTYWPEEYIVTSMYSSQNFVDGIIFVRDCYCNAGIEEINILQNIVKDMKIPSIIVNYNLEAQSSVETSLETFVEMLEWRKIKEKK